MQTLAGDGGLGWSQVFILLLPFLLAVSFWAASDPQLEVMALAGVGDRVPHSSLSGSRNGSLPLPVGLEVVVTLPHQQP